MGQGQGPWRLYSGKPELARLLQWAEEDLEGWADPAAPWEEAEPHRKSPCLSGPTCPALQ